MSGSTEIRAGLSPGPLAEAKKRQPKPWRWWHIVLGLLALVIGVPAGWYVWSRVSMGNEWAAAVAEAEQDMPRWTLLEMEEDRPTVPPAENSALFLMALRPKIRAASLGAAPNYELIFDKLPPNVQLNGQQSQHIRAAFAKIGNAREEARKVKDLPRGRFPIKHSDDWISTLLPNHQDARETANVLMHDAMLLAQDGDYERAIEACQACLTLGGSMREDPFLIVLLIRYSIGQVAIGSLERVLAQAESFDDRTLQAMQAALERETIDDGFLTGIRGDRAGMHHLFENARTGKVDLRALGGMNVLKALLGSKDDRTSFGDRLAQAFPSLMLRQYPDHLKEMNRCVEICKLPIHERGAKLDEWEKRVRSSNSLTRLLAPGLAKVHFAACRHQVMIRSAAVAVACERYRLKHGRWPAALEVLVADKLIESIPADPMDNEPLRFRRTKEGLVIYSIGHDKKDDGGNIDRDRVIDPGVDIGFRLWHVVNRRQPARPPAVLPEVER